MVGLLVWAGLVEPALTGGGGAAGHGDRVAAGGRVQVAVGGSWQQLRAGGGAVVDRAVAGGAGVVKKPLVGGAGEHDG
jgi:hypothetical protein